MQLPRFIPEELRQLARFVPLSGWDAIEWKAMLGSMRAVSWRFATGSGVNKLGAAVNPVIPSIDIVTSLGDAAPIDDVVDQARLQLIGDDILRLYFGQWLVDAGLFIDLRSSRFAVAGEQLRYAPGGLWIRLQPDFRDGMLALYRSFYSADDEAFEGALRQMGLLHPSLSAAGKSELKDMLHSHFGIDQGAQRFSIDAFKASFDDLFEFFIANNYKLHSDFVWVGFYLVTLYLTLEQGGQAHDVRRICSEMLL